MARNPSDDAVVTLDVSLFYRFAFCTKDWKCVLTTSWRIHVCDIVTSLIDICDYVCSCGATDICSEFSATTTAATTDGRL